MASTSTSMPGKTKPTTTAVDAGYGAVRTSARIVLKAAYSAGSARYVVRRRTESERGALRAKDRVEVGQGLAELGLEAVRERTVVRKPAWPDATTRSPSATDWLKW